MVPFPRSIYPWFFVSSILFDVGTIPLMNSPLVPDYISVESIGKALAYEKIFEVMGGLVGG